MGSATPPKRMTRARAAAASATATALGTKSTQSAKVTKSSKATSSTKATVASAKKAIAAKKTATSTLSTTSATTSATTPAPASATASINTTAAKKSAAAKKPTTAKKPAAAKKTAAKTATKAAATTSTTSTRPTTRKRKDRASDDDDDEDDLSKEDTTQPIMNRPAKKLRGSAKKAVDPKPEPESEHESEPQPKPQQSTAARTTRATRGRPKGSTAATAASSAPKTEASSTTSRKRTRSTTTKDDVATTAKPAPKTRGRRAAGTVTTTYTTEPTPGLKSAVSRPASKPASVLKKTVTFQEPEKENLPPPATAKANPESSTTTATGMSAKPVRKPASGRTTRASARAAATDVTEKKPLSPKKDGQNLPLSRDVDSDDELATYEKTPLKPLMKSPIKPPIAVRKLELPPLEKEKDGDSPPTLEPTLPSVLMSPARRPPPSPFKDTMKSPAKRVDAVPSLLFPSTSTETQGAQSPSKPTLLQSPAKRPHMSLQPFQFNQEQVGVARSPAKMSLLGTPAKRPVSPLKLPGSSVLRMEEKPQEAPQETPDTPMEEESDVDTTTTEGDDADITMEEDDGTHTRIEEEVDTQTPTKTKEDISTLMEEISEEELQYQIRAEIGLISPNEKAAVEKTLSPIQEVDNEDSIQFKQLGSHTPQLAFPGRLSAVLPRHADPALKQNPILVPDLPAYSSQPNNAESQKLGSISTSESAEHEFNANATSYEPMDGSEAIPERQPTETHAARSEEGCVDTSQTLTTEKSEEVHDVCEAESDKQANEQFAIESKEQGMEVSKLGSDKCEVNTEEPTVSSPTKTPLPKAARKQPEEDGVSNSEDELAFSNKTITKFQDATSTSDPQPSTPAPLFKGTERKVTESAARAASRAIRSVSKVSSFGFSVQLGSWRAASPLKARQTQQKSAPQTEEDKDEDSLLEENSLLQEKIFAVETPSAKGYFDDEMRIRDEMEENQAEIEALLEADIAAKFDKHDFNDLGLMDDISVVTDDGMSPFNTPRADRSYSQEKSISEASQEYGDENAIPIDPALVGNRTDAQLEGHNPVTPPKRTFSSREFHTVSKVPLKRGDDSPPRDVKRHCSTVSKISLQRPAPFSNVSVPSQRSSRVRLEEQTDEDDQLPLVTPSKPAPRSLLGTPARTTRVDLDSKLLSGAIIFVDVHTTDGADAGRIFVDVLNQMGARCVKSWPWNPSSTTDGQVDVSKIGITHVVFKDGGKRTLEKVMESNGAVECVGVSWVLDCEKENRWVNEKDYRVDPALIPRGGHNRRKSMEPKAIANSNGTLVTPMKANSAIPREPQTVPNNYMSRRDSTVWMRSPSDHDEDEDAPSEPSEMDWESTNAPILTPFPQTPAPEMVAKFAMDISPGTPTLGSFAFTPGNNQPLMQTCPPKPSGLTNIGESFVSRNQDPIAMRLMAARRKSMQFAPKVASPLKKQWKQMD